MRDKRDVTNEQGRDKNLPNLQPMASRAPNRRRSNQVMVAEVLELTSLASR